MAEEVVTAQEKKYFLGLAGEFLVAGELLRRGISAAVTYGNAKKADVFAHKGSTATALEVKSTSKEKWVVGNSMPIKDANKIWVLVYLPIETIQPPEFYIATGAELHEILAPRNASYRTKYREKHGREFDGKGVYSVQKRDVQAFKSRWDKIESALSVATVKD